MIGQATDWLGANGAWIGSISGALGAIFAGLALVYSAAQTRQAAASTDFDGLLRLQDMVKELEIDQAAAADQEDINAATRASVDIYNKLETLSGGVRHKLLGKHTRKSAAVFLIDMIALQEHYTDLRKIAAVRQGVALEDVTWFSATNRRQINDRKREYDEMDEMEKAEVL